MRKLLRQRGASWIQGWFSGLHKTRLPHKINCLTQAAAFALRHEAVLDEQTQANRAEGDRLFDAASTTPSGHVCPSEANFILLWLPAESADACFAVLKARGSR